MRMVRRIYEKAGLPMTEAAAQEMRHYAEQHPRGKHGQIVYDLKQDFGADPTDVRGRFDFYFQRFPVKIEG